MAAERVLHYRIVRPLGAGGMGEVYLARDESLDRDVALKFLTASATSDSLRLERLRREARALAALAHPNIAAVFALETSPRPFVVMEFVEGETLGEHMRRGALGPDRAPTIVRDVARALGHAHARGIVHRDVKPDNIIIRSDGSAKLTDFGIARVEDAPTLTAEGFTLGTIAYMSPEQARVETVDARSDVFSLGVVLWEGLTGRHPFAADRPEVTIYRIQHHDPDGPGAAMPRDLERIVRKCLEKDPTRRYRDGEELAADLDRATRAAPAAAPRQRRAKGASHHTLMIVPLEVRGQDEAEVHVGRTFAEALAVNLAQAKGLVVLPVPEPGELRSDGALTRAHAAARAGAGRLLYGALTRSGGSTHVSLTLVDTRENRILWGTSREGGGGELPLLADRLARDATTALGLSRPRLYDHFNNATGSAEMARSPRTSAALGAIRRMDSSARDAAAELVRAFPNEPDAHVLLCVALYRNASNFGPSAPELLEFERAAAVLERIDPRNPWPEHLRNILLSRHGHMSQSLEGFGRTLARRDLTPSARAVILIMRAQVLADMGRREDALADYQEALGLDPVSDLGYVILALTLSTMGRHDEALDRARQAVALNPASAQNQRGVGSVLMRMGRFEDALAPLAAACANSNESVLQVDLAFHALALLRTGQSARAREVALQASQSRESDFGTWALARYFAAAGERGEALRLLERSLALGPLLSYSEIDIEHDPEFQPLRSEPGLSALVAEVARRFPTHAERLP